MFNIFNKPNITFWTEIEGLDKVAPVVPAKKFIPRWFKNISSAGSCPQGGSLPIHSNITRCPGFVDYFKNGYVVQMWCDLYFRFDSQNQTVTWETPDERFTLQFHGEHQFIDHLPIQAQKKIITVAKPFCPWHVKTSPGYSLYQLPMYYEYNEYFEVLPGIYESDKYHEINQQICILKDGEFVIEQGTPLALYVPFKRQSFDFDVTIETPELKKIRDTAGLNISTKFYNRLRRLSK